MEQRMGEERDPDTEPVRDVEDVGAGGGEGEVAITTTTITTATGQPQHDSEASNSDEDVGRRPPASVGEASDCENADDNNNDDDHANDNDDDEDNDNDTSQPGRDEEGETQDKDATNAPAAPPLPSEPVPGAAGGDDGWSAQWDPTHQAWYFHNRFTGNTQWDNPRVPSTSSSSSQQPSPSSNQLPAQAQSQPQAQAHAPPLPQEDRPIAGGYNPAIHGDYDPTAWYAQPYETPQPDDQHHASADGGFADAATDLLVVQAGFNRWTGHFQPDDQGPERYSDEAKARRQMGAFFDVDAAANAHDGRSLKAERAGKRLSKAELRQFKEKRKARKEEKRRAWLRD